MTRRSLASAAAIGAVLALLAPASGLADPTAAGSGTFEYGPYKGGTTGSDNSSGQDQNTEPAEQAAPPPAAPSGPDVVARPDDRPAYGAPAPWHNPDADNDDDDDDRADGPPPNGAEPPLPRAAAGPPPDTFSGAAIPRIEVSASAPDTNVPADIRTHDARKAAIGAWREKVASRFGPEFAHWRTAAGKRVDCHPEPAAGIVCIVSAEPVRGIASYGQGQRDHY